MSKEVEWSEYHGCGDIICTCDECGESYLFEFCDGYPDFREAQREIEQIGWQSARINGEWEDFCCSTCRNKYIRENL